MSFQEAHVAAIRRQAEGHGADFSDEAAMLALSDQLGFVRNVPISEEDVPVDLEGPDAEVHSTIHVVLAWDCESEAAIILGRLARRGWRLVRP